MTTSPSTPSGIRLGRRAAIVDIALAAALAGLLLVVTNGPGDVVPRPLALLALYATPGIVGGVGVLGGRRGLVWAATIVLIPGSLLSMAGVTLVFILPAVLFAATAIAIGPGRAAGFDDLVDAILPAALVIAAGVALFRLTANTCETDPSAAACSSAALTFAGVGLELALLAAAVSFAAWRAGLPRTIGALRRGDAS